jgi:hypothetical protein
MVNLYLQLRKVRRFRSFLDYFMLRTLLLSNPLTESACVS